MERLNCHVKTYAWGKVGSGSEVCRLYAAGHKSFKPNEDQTYAELWMGTHPDGPAQVEKSGKKLSTVIACRASGADLRKLDENRYDYFELHLPFIMKVMSIRHTLSLQVHPTKEQAAKLNQLDPLNYPDKNHKPELALALTTFELVCGFRPAKEIAENLQCCPSFRSVFGGQNAQHFVRLVSNGVDQDSQPVRTCLAAGFRHMMNISKKQAETLVGELIMSTNGTHSVNWLPSRTRALIRKMFKEFPGDVGCFSPLYLNHIILQPGQCCYYGPQELHAYLSGECIECVSNSNNTIRAALTPKHKDMEILCETINYRMADPSFYMVTPTDVNGYPHVKLFDPTECPDFKLHQMMLSSPGVVTLPALLCDGILVIVQGAAGVQRKRHTLPKALHFECDDDDIFHISRGDIFHIGPGEEVTFRVQKEIDCPFLAYRTFSYEPGPAHGERNRLPTNDDAQSQRKLEEMLKFAAKVKMTAAKCNTMFDLALEMDGFC